MRVASIVLLVAVVLAGSASMSAQQVPGGLTMPPWFPTAQAANSLGNLFPKPGKAASTAPLLFTTPSLDQRVPQALRVVCGMTLIPADPKLDAAIRHAVPENGPKFTIRTVDPQTCRR